MQWKIDGTFYSMYVLNIPHHNEGCNNRGRKQQLTKSAADTLSPPKHGLISYKCGI
jgi:hypothetical protein